MRDIASRGIRRRSFLVDVRHCRLKEAIALELGNELLVRNGGFSPALCYDGKIFQVLQQFFVVGDWKNDGCAFAAIVSDIFNGIAHGRNNSSVGYGLKIGRDGARPSRGSDGHRPPLHFCG